MPLTIPPAMPSRLFLSVIAFVVGVTCFTCRVGYSQSAQVDFQRDIQPILSEHCMKCHGGDSETREGGLRLDVRDAALKGGESGESAIVPGKPDSSELIRRITSQDADVMMPPPTEKKPLNENQIGILTKWVSQGASYDLHWAFVAPQKSPLPGSGFKNPIDAFILAKLNSLNLQPSAPASSSALCRRLYLDLIGLPPSPRELDAFQKDGFDKTVEKLLASERFGEKWARHWLDVARYSDTNGYEKDMRRDQWIWRDWVIKALNQDMPYDQFIVEQVAGDLLPNATQDQVVATGFLRNSMINEEGAIVPEQFRMVEMFDRMDCLGKAVLGLTTQCAQCHSHKFDPLTHDEYYGLFAFINNTYEAKSWVYTEDQQKLILNIQSEVQSIEAKLRSANPQWEQELSAWQSDILAKQLHWQPLDAVELGSISGLNHPTQQPDKSLLMLGHTSGDIFMISHSELAGVTGLQIEVLTHRDLPFNGPGRGSTGTWGISEIEVSVQKEEGKGWEKLKLVNASADFSEAERKLDEKNEKKRSGPVQFLIDGTDDTSWEADRGVGRRNQPSVAVVQFERPLSLPGGSQLKIALRMNEMVGCCRISTTTAANPAVLSVAHSANLALKTKQEERTTEQHAAIFMEWRRSRADCKTFNDAIDAQWKRFPEAPTSVLHLAERTDGQTRKTHLLDRGNWDQPLKVVEPATPAIFHPLAEGSSPARLAFGRWLADRRSPLTARVAVNRIWNAIFGEGIVETAEDFGTRAPMPVHRELLDWLAVDFMEHGWSQKHVVRMIVSSATYHQDSKAKSSMLEQDPRNQLLARGPRFRADAEVVRDMALSMSGLITHRIGGPGVIPPVPQNVLDYNYVYPSYWTPATGDERYRRTVYGFRKRSMPDPVMSTFDAPNGDFACARRVRSNTPLAALTGLNEAIFVEAARAFALRILREAGPDDAKRADHAFLICTSRLPSAEEREAIVSLVQSRRQRLAEGWLNPREISTGNAAQLPPLPPNATPQDAGAWTIAARVLLNLDETLSKN